MSTKIHERLTAADGLRAQVLVADSLFRLQKDGRLLKAAASGPVGNISKTTMRARTAERVQKTVETSGGIAVFAVLNSEIDDDGTVLVAEVVGASTEQGLIGEGAHGVRGTLPDQDATVLFADPATSHDEANHPILP